MSAAENTAQQPQQPAIDIPVIDIRAATPTAILKDPRAKTGRAIKEHARMTLGIFRFLHPLVMRIADFFSRRWLKKSNNPYLKEIEETAKAIGKPGIVALNLSYEIGCTTFAANHPNGPKLARVMDWQLPGLGETVVVAHQQGKAGEFYNITWPGLSGMFNGVAKDRFAAAINQAPERRHKGGIILGRIKNMLLLGRQKGLPPAHLLRKTFETAANYQEAKKMLSTEPVAAPVMFTLAGTKAGEGCVIERTENKAVIREMQNGKACVANHFETSLNGEGYGWMPRGEPPTSQPRMDAANAALPANLDESFTWFKEPIANPNTRLVFVGDAAAGTLSVMGTDGAKPATKILKI
ncbi:MAG: hypothetical protein EPN97_07870 [Alphaproteobacteria bacterium]|nr:MAG: hypothetical protein EPN97_07870 [Alphaproteobacteria bacterium]